MCEQQQGLCSQMNSLEPGSHMLAKKTAYLFDTDFNTLSLLELHKKHRCPHFQILVAKILQTSLDIVSIYRVSGKKYRVQTCL